jgi:hypothetical protein
MSTTRPSIAYGGAAAALAGVAGFGYASLRDTRSAHAAILMSDTN